MGGGGKFSAGCFSTGKFSMGKEVSRGEFVRGNYVLGEFARIPRQNSFYVMLSLYRFIFTELKVIDRGKFSPGLNCLENISVGRGILPLKWGQIS